MRDTSLVRTAFDNLSRKIRSLRASIIFLAGLAACATPPAQIAITPQSTDAAVVIATDAWPIAYELDIDPYDAERGALTEWTSAGLSYFAVPVGGRNYFTIKVAPGRYAFREYRQQSLWMLCFHDNSLAFDVGPGEVVYLGRFAAVRHSLQLQQLVMANGDTTTSIPVRYFDDILQPQIEPPVESDLALVRAHLAATSPLTTAEPRLARYELARFGTGSGPLGGTRTCGNNNPRDAAN